MEKFYKNNRKDIFAILLILLLSTIIRLFLLSSIPTNISGDEVTNLSNVYTILFGHKNYLLSFMGDGSVMGIVFYWSALLIKLFGLNNTIFALRLSFSIFSIMSLVPFYLILRNKTSIFISFISTALLSANYVFLNFSRTAWINMIAVFSGLFLIFFIERALSKKDRALYILSGIFAGISFYSYHYGRILVAAIFIYLIINLCLKRFEKNTIKGFIIFILTAVLVSFPFFLSIISGGQESILRRPSATFAFSSDKLSSASNKFADVFLHQISYTIKGFIFLDGSVMSEGTENSRYLPFKTPPVNLIIKILFFLGIIYFVLRKRSLIWFFVIFSILITQAMSDLPPNFSRGLLYIPIIYFVVGLFLHDALNKIVNHFKVKKKITYIYSLLLAFALLIFIYDAKIYFSWMKSPSEYDSRQPAIDYKEFEVWQNYQIKRVKTGQLPVTNYEWYQLRPFFLSE